MSLYKPDNSPCWYYDFTVRGNRFRRSTETDDKELAEIIEADAHRRELLGTVIEIKPTMTLDAAFGRYWLDHASKLKTWETLQYQIKQLRTGFGKELGLERLNDERVSDYVSRRRGMTAYRRKALISEASVNRELDLLRAVARMAEERWGVEVGKVNWKAQRLREAGNRHRYLLPEEARRVIDCAAAHVKEPIRFSLLTGLRLSNVVGLDWSQVDLAGRVIDFRLKSILRDGKPFVLPINDAALVLLANLGPKERGPVFTRRGRPIKDCRHAWVKALERAKITDFRWHDLRHTAGSWMVQNGVPLDVVKDLFGHANIRTTMRYAHRAPTAKIAGLDAAADMLNRRSSAELRQSDAAPEEQVSDAKDRKESA